MSANALQNTALEELVNVVYALYSLVLNFETAQTIRIAYYKTLLQFNCETEIFPTKCSRCLKPKGARPLISSRIAF